MLPQFTHQPDEEKELQPKVVAALKAAGHSVYIEKTCDLIILRENSTPLNIELKVRLHSQRQKIPITPFQWSLFRSIGTGSSFDQHTRILICDSTSGKYALIGVPDLVPGLTQSSPSSTSYVTKAHLDNLTWKDPAEAWKELTTWIEHA